MITTEIKLAKSRILEEIAKTLDITDSQMELAKRTYTAVGTWLGKEGSPLEQYEVTIYPQGSFLLGTVIKPILGEDKYDIDLVCLLSKGSSDHITQYELKNMVGDRLKENLDYKRMLDNEKRRCWTLNYSEDTKFHMDILPCLPDPQFSIIHHQTPNEISDHSIKITDNLKDNYSLLSSKWNRSNPKGYFEWFKGRMITSFNLSKGIQAELRGVHIDQVQDFEVRTPLQRAIQILKRHRDIKYGSNEDKPISIIITTLAARSYNGESNIFEALQNIVEKMEKYVEIKYESGKAVFWVENPVNSSENFADKWENQANKQKIFFNWLTEVKENVLEVFALEGKHNILNQLKPYLGEKTINKASQNLGISITNHRKEGNLKFNSSVGTIGFSGDKRVHNHNFYGED